MPAGRYARRTTEGKMQTELIEKTRCDTLDAVVSVQKGVATPSQFPSKGGLHMRFATNVENQVEPSHLVSTTSAAITSVRIKERISFLSNKSDFSINCTRVRSGGDRKNASEVRPTYEVNSFSHSLSLSFSHTHSFLHSSIFLSHLDYYCLSFCTTRYQIRILHNI
jgi:hypothetical protein